jgi:hypothetical protein
MHGEEIEIRKVAGETDRSISSKNLRMMPNTFDSAVPPLM